MFKQFLNNLRLSVKIALLGGGSVLITAIALLWLAVWQSNQYNLLSQREVDTLVDANLDQITQDVYNLVRTENEAVQQQVDYSLNVAHYIFAGGGSVSLSPETEAWTAVNQFTNKSVKLQLPKMLVGGRWLGQNRAPGVETPVVDEITRLVGETATIFQRINDSGDMLRVATTVKTEEGKRAIGTYIPAINPDGTPNPVISAIKSGKTYHGRAFVVNAWYLTAYRPVKDRSGKLAGMLYVGIKQKNIESRVRQAILQTRVGKTGYMYVLGGKGEQRGRYIISQKGERDGENVWDSKDSDGRYVIQSIINKAVTLKPGEVATERYRWQNPGEKEPRWKVARLAYYQPWDWVIGTSVYEDELQTYRTVLSEGRIRMISFMGLAGLAITLLIGLLGAMIAWTIARPVRQMKDAVETIIEGNLDQVVEVHSQDEIGALARAFNVMTERLHSDNIRRQRDEVTIREINERFSSVLRAATAYSIVGADLDGIIKVFNEGAELMLGYRADEVIDKATPEIFHDPEEVAARAAEMGISPGFEVFVAAARQGKTEARDWTYICKDGSRITVSLTVAAMQSESGGLSGFIGIAQDITERKRLEEQLLQSQKMESIGRLAGGVAHDFNNMLGVIIGSAELLRRRLQEDDPACKFIDHIFKAAERSSKITRQLLAFSRKEIIAPRPVNLNSQIIESEKMLARLISEDIKLTFHPATSIWTVKIDPSQLDQILMNLSANARDAMPDGGCLTIETENVQIAKDYCQHHLDARVGEYVRLTISDTGHGMDHEIQKHIFEPFFTTKGVGQGTGLGLATVYGIVIQNHGFINVYSEPGQGTVFRIYLPRLVEDAVAEEPSPATMPSGSGTILLVEDEEMLLWMTTKLLEEMGYKVIQAQTPQTAINICENGEQEIDLILTDVVMPGMNGREMVERIRINHPEIKVIFMSGYTADIVAKRGIVEEGMVFVTKPLEMNMLNGKIRDILGR